jgi:hexosaminidase
MSLTTIHADTKPSLIPWPQEVEFHGTKCPLNERLYVIHTGDAPNAYQWLEQNLSEQHSLQQFESLRNERLDMTDATLLLMNVNEQRSDLGEEGYQLTVVPEGLQLEGATPTGVFYGVVTLLQLIQTDSETDERYLPTCKIVDQPRFRYRGMHLDVCRHFQPAEFVKKYLDLLAMHKMNRFHWHLTEDQGWRIEIKKYPKLQEISAWRDETLIGHARHDKPHKFDGIPHGGYYTQEEIREIVEYAAARHITIIPEIEMPGHSLAALAAYPHLACTEGPFEVAKTWGVFKDVYCAGNEATFEFLEDVLTETMALFPSEYIHVGGDECPKDRWKECEKSQARIKAEGLADEHELQSYFIQRIEKFLNDNGRKLIGWDEILEGGLAPNATVMSWRGEKGGIEAAKAGHDVVMTPGKPCYFDHYQSEDTENEPLAIGGLNTLASVYAYEPVPAELSADEAKHVLGAQGNVWTEYMKTGDHIEYMVLPRLCALSEVVWSEKISDRDYEGFLTRLEPHLEALESKGYNYREPDELRETDPAK